jgi:hypothetical protein
VTAEEPIPTTVRERLTTARLSAGRIEQHLAASWVHVDGQLVTDLGTPAPPRARLMLWDG